MPVTIVQNTIGAIIIFTTLTNRSPEHLEARPEVGEQEPDQDSQGQADQDLYVEELEYFRGLGLHGGVSFDDATASHDELHSA